MQKKGHYRRPADDAIDDDEEYDDKKKDCAVCMSETIQETESSNNKNKDVRQEFLHHKQHSMKKHRKIIETIHKIFASQKP